MAVTHIIIDAGSENPVGLALGFVDQDCNRDLDTFAEKADWGWDEEKKMEVFELAIDALEAQDNPSTPAAPTSPFAQPAP